MCIYIFITVATICLSYLFSQFNKHQITTRHHLDFYFLTYWRGRTLFYIFVCHLYFLVCKLYLEPLLLYPRRPRFRSAPDTVLHKAQTGITLSPFPRLHREMIMRISALCSSPSKSLPIPWALPEKFVAVPGHFCHLLLLMHTCAYSLKGFGS